MRIIYLLILVIMSFHSAAQDSVLTVSGFLDVYYAYDFNKPRDKNRQYTTQPLRHNELNLNWGYIKVDYALHNIRSTFAMHTGTFVQANYANETELIRMIYQASIGYKFGRKISIDAGIMPSHIGMESAVSLDNWNYSRNLQSDYSPYYQAGVHVSADISEKFKAKLALLNGFQIVKENNNAKSLGLLLNYYPHKNWELGYSNYFGNEAPSDSVFINGELQKLSAKYRYFNHLFVRGKLSNRLSIATIGEFNIQERLQDEDIAKWYTVVAILKYDISKHWSLAARGEVFHDQDQIVANTGTVNGFRVRSYTLTINFYPTDHTAIRLEGRTYSSEDAIYVRANAPMTDNDSFLTVSMAVKF